MGKVTYKELPKDHPIYKAGWLISTVKNQSQTIKQYKEGRLVENAKKWNFWHQYQVFIESGVKT